MNSPGQESSDVKDGNSPPDSHTNGNDSKRRKPAANGRGVNTLSKEALDKKRDNDRKAQAAIRRRQKEEVANLKREIEMLNSQQPYLDLKTVLDDKNAIQDDYDKMRAALAAFIDTVQPLMSPAIQDLAAAAHHNAQTALANSRSSESTLQYPAPDHSNYTSSSPFATTHQHFSEKSPSLPHRGPILSEQRDFIQRHHQLNKDESLDFRFLFDSTSSDPSRRNPVLPQRQLSTSLLPSAANHESHQPWNTLPLISPPDTPLDKLLTDFINDHQQASALPRSSVYPTNPSISNLLNPLDSTASSASASPDISRHMREPNANVSPAPDALSSYMTRIVSWFDGITGLPEKVAVSYVMYGILRWQTYPTKENYYLLPEMLRPCASQTNIPHPAWVDHLPWPEMRDKVVRGQQDRYRFSRSWFEPFTEGLSVNWPYSETTCLVNTGKDGQEEICPAFLEHISRPESWTLGPQFFNNFPELRGTAPCKDKAQNPINSRNTNGNVLHGTRNVAMDAEYSSNRGNHSYEQQRQSNNVRQRDRGG